MATDQNPIYVTSRALRRAARAARALRDDELAVDLLMSGISAGNRKTLNRGGRSVGDYLSSVRIAAEYGLTLSEALALGPEDLLDLFWPENAPRRASDRKPSNP